MKPRNVDYPAMWAKVVNDQEGEARKDQSSEHWESIACRLGLGLYKAHCFCERLASAYSSPWLNPTAVEAGRLYLINKHHWLPEQVSGLEMPDLQGLLHVELVEMKLNDREWLPVQYWTTHMDCHEDLARSAAGA